MLRVMLVALGAAREHPFRGRTRILLQSVYPDLYRTSSGCPVVEEDVTRKSPIIHGKRVAADKRSRETLPETPDTRLR
jgi:hypothetical protein